VAAGSIYPDAYKRPQPWLIVLTEGKHRIGGLQNDEDSNDVVHTAILLDCVPEAGNIVGRTNAKDAVAAAVRHRREFRG
jgi:hypothetical protein